MTCILQLGPLSERFNRTLAAEHEVLPIWKADAEALLAEHAQRIEVVVTSARFGCSAALIERLPRLRAICSFGRGLRLHRCRRGAGVRHSGQQYAGRAE